MRQKELESRTSDPGARTHGLDDVIASRNFRHFDTGPGSLQIVIFRCHGREYLGVKLVYREVQENEGAVVQGYRRSCR